MRFTLFAAATAAFLCNLASAQEQCNGLEDAAKDACDMAAAFGGSKVFPDVIPSFDPIGALYVTYGTVTVGGAQQLSPSRVNAQPTVAYTPSKDSAKSDTKYLLIMVDHDAPTPSNNSLADIVHWMASDLTVGSKGVLSSSTPAPAPYGGPNPPQTSTAHRYVFLLYEQPTSFTLPDAAANLPATIAGGRRGFKLANFVSDGKLGNPVAGSFFKSVYDGIPLPASSSSSSSAASTATGGATARNGTSGSHSSASNSSSSPAASSGSGSNSSTAPVAATNSTNDTSGTGALGFDLLSAGMLGLLALMFV